MMKPEKMGAAIIFVAFLVTAANGEPAAAFVPQKNPEQNPASKSSPLAPAISPSTSEQTQGKVSDARARQQAYLRFAEARRLKDEAQRMRNARLLDDAIRAYKETIQLDPSSAEPHVDLGELYFFFQSRRDLAEREAQEAVKLDPACAGGHLLLARLYSYAVRLENNSRSPLIERAIHAYEKVTELDPRHTEAWAMLAELHGIKTDTGKQIHALEKWAGSPIPNDTLFYNTVMNSDLSSDQAYYRLSRLYLGQGKNEEAVSAAKRAYESNPESNDYARNLISILRVAGTSAEELRVYRRLMKSAASPALMVGYGSALVRAGRYTEAIETLREYVALDPSNASAVGLLAIAQRRANQRAAAIETLKAGIAKADEGVRAELALELAQTYEEAGRNEEAIAQYEQVFDGLLNKTAQSPSLSPLFGEVVNRLIRVCRRTGSQTKLQSVLTKTRRAIDEQNPLLDLITIESLREDGKRREALELAQAAARRRPEDRSLKFTEAIILGEMKRFNESVELLRSMIKGESETATDDAGVYLILSSVQMQSGQLKAAEESARQALELNPDDPQALVQLSSVLDRAGRHESSEKILRDLLKREPDNAAALNNLGYFMVGRGAGYQEALRLIEQAVAIDPINASFLDSLGWTYLKLGNIEKAREYLEKALIYSKRNSTIHEHFGDALREAGQLNEARKQWEKALEYSIEADETARLRGKLKDAR
ncbi:MAG: Beta-barrel assembly-enhancing protease [Acidobacteria bacterium]|nr:Beta-barrel assembly-enhancing protease [Acidobacteriota bacterium]